MESFLNIGFGNSVNVARLLAIISPDSAPARRMVQNGRENGRVVDATQGRRTRAVLVMDNDYLILSALQPETLAGRYRGKASADDSDRGDKSGDRA